MEIPFHLEYRGEGNRAIVFANTQTKQVYRLVKCKATQKIRKLLKSSISDRQTEARSVHCAVISELENVINYISNVIKPLLSDRFVVTPKLAIIPEYFGEQAIALVDHDRPAHRKKLQFNKVDPDARSALILPDFCFVSRTNGTCANNSVHSPVQSQTVVSGELLDTGRKSSLDGDHDLRTSSCCSIGSLESGHHRIISDGVELTESFMEDGCEDGYVSDSMNLILADAISRGITHRVTSNGDNYIKGPLSETPCEKNSVDIDIAESTNTFCKEKQEEYDFTLSIEIKPKKAFISQAESRQAVMGQDQVCHFCMHQILKRKDGKWPETSSYCPLDLFSGNKQRMKHALLSLVKTPQNNLKICKNGREVYGSEIRQDLSAILEDWLPAWPGKKQKLVSMFMDLVIEILLSTDRDNGDKATKATNAPVGNTFQKCSSSSFVHSDQACSGHLPQGCVLERIYSAQCLDTLDTEGVFPLYKALKSHMEEEPRLRYAWGLNGLYHNMSWQFGQRLQHSEPSESESDVLKVKQFLVSRTMQDCSIIVAIKPLPKSAEKTKFCVRFGEDLFNFSIHVVDLDPKPFEKIRAYHQQESDIAMAFAEMTSQSS